MARITLSELAPDEALHFDLAGYEFDLGGNAKAAHETDDRVVLGNAQVHPWLDVEYDKVELIAGQTRHTLADFPERDSMSGVGPNATIPYDAEEIRKVEEAKAEGRENLLAVDADLDQGEAQSVGVEGGDEVAVTIAADESHEAAKSAKAFDQSDESADAAAAGEEQPAPRKTSKKGDN